ncbi:MAG: hypothetical protein K2G88_01190 [Oscillospiraceae bacterium]|nr:hypothetical protein [Oscillospiraceae bacterium]
MKFKNSEQWKKTTTINEELLKESDLLEELLERFRAEATDAIDISEECSEYMDLTYRRGE